MNNNKRILACVDQSQYAEHVVEYASWAAKRMEAQLELLHIIDRNPMVATASDHSGTIGIDAQEALMNELVNQDEARSKDARERGRIFLNHLREHAMMSGIESPDVRLRAGVLEDVLVEQENGVSLFVLGRRGESAETTQRDLGRNLESVVRALRKPILTVTASFTEPHQVMLAFDGGGVTRRGVEMIAASPLFHGLPIHLVMSGKGGQNAAKQLHWAKATLSSAGFDVIDSMIPGDAERIIAQYVLNQKIDMLIMGAYSHSPLRGLFFGSKTSDLLRSAKIPTLLMR